MVYRMVQIPSFTITLFVGRNTLLLLPTTTAKTQSIANFFQGMRSETSGKYSVDYVPSLKSNRIEISGIKLINNSTLPEL